MDAPATSPHIRIRLALTYSLLSSILCAGMLAIAKNSLLSVSVNQLTFFRNLIALILLFPFIAYSKKKLTYRQYLHTPHFRIHLIRALVGLLTVFLFLTSLQTISISEANILYNTTPLFIPLVLFIWKKKPIDYRGWPGIAIAFIGILFLMRPQNASYASGLFLALLSGIAGAISMVVQRHIYNQEPFYRSLFFYILFSIVITGVLLPFEQTTSVFSLSQKDLIFLFSMGISAFFTQVFLSLSIKYAPSKLIAPFAYLSLIFSLSIDVIFWGKIPCMAEMLGMGFIMAGLGLFLFVASKPGLSQKASLSNE